MKYYIDFFITTVYLINKMPTPTLDYKSPFEIIYQIETSYSHLRVFGCLCFAFTLSHAQTKFELRARRYAFLGYPYGVKGHKLLNLATYQIFVSHDANFHEEIFHFKLPEHHWNLLHPFSIRLTSFHSLTQSTTFLRTPLSTPLKRPHH